MSTPSDPSDLTPEEARDRWLSHRRQDAADRTLRSYRSRSERFLTWCEEESIERVGDLSPWLVDEFGLWVRDREHAPSTVKGVLTTNRLLLKYLVGIGAIPEEVPEAVTVPTLDRSEASSDLRLAPEDAERLLEHYRDDPATFGTPEHAILELVWYTGARLGAIRGLDLDDYEPDENRIRFRHRPDSGTPLKNKRDGERYVGLSDDVVAALDTYIARERYNKRDEGGRRPLFSARQGRPSYTTLRAWCYRATQPCVYGPCPHGQDPATCEYRERNHASKCPSSRAPHHLRTGSITWQLNRGLTTEQVSGRVNASARVIRDFYDAAEDLEKFEQRREAAQRQLAADSSPDDESDGPPDDPPSDAQQDHEGENRDDDDDDPSATPILS